MAHFLDRLLRPASIAVLGASRRHGSVGNTVIRNLLRGGYGGPLFAVNPGYPEVEGVACFPDLASLPERVQQVIFAIGDEHLEPALAEAVAQGAESCVIFSSLLLARDTEPALRERIRRMIQEAGLLVSGANGMGYYNFRDRVWACGFDTRSHRPGGNVTLISQSGSGMSAILDVEERIDFNFAVSTGQELSVTLEDYLDYALEQPETRVIGLFLETSRCPEKLVAALEKAAARRIPVVAVKVGRTELSATLAVSHSGALAGNDAVYDAVFRRYGVQRVDDLDELATVLIMFAQPHAPAAGGLVAMHDSGGERQLFIDLAQRHDVPLTVLAPGTAARLEELLDPGLPAVNPLDAWSAGGPGYHVVMGECFTTLLSDPTAALGAVIHARAPHGRIYPAYTEYLRKAHAATGKPVFLVAARQGAGMDPLVLDVTREGFPVLDGVAPFLIGARCLMAYRDFLRCVRAAPPIPGAEVRSRWTGRLRAGDMRESEALAFLADCGIPAVRSQFIASESELLARASGFTYPVVLKTAQPAIRHKSDVGGVRLGIGNEAELLGAYRELAARHGPLVTVADMIEEPGVEMILGMHTDEQFGPVIVMGIGGIHAELLADSVTMLPPFDAEEARRLLDGLKMRKLLDGVRGVPAVDVEAFCRAAARLSAVAMSMADLVREIDLNPVKVLACGCAALDALIVGHTPPSFPVIARQGLA